MCVCVCVNVLAILNKNGNDDNDDDNKAKHIVAGTPQHPQKYTESRNCQGSILL